MYRALRLLSIDFSKILTHPGRRRSQINAYREKVTINDSLASPNPGSSNCRCSFSVPSLWNIKLDTVFGVSRNSMRATSASDQWCGALTSYRSEERRVGKELVSTCRSRWSTFNKTKQTT